MANRGAQRHRKILRDNIDGITKPALQRILRRAGVKRIGGTMYEELRGFLKEFMETIIGNMITLTEHARRKTVMIPDLELALQNNGIILAAGLNENAKKTTSLQSCNARGKKRAPGVEAPTKGKKASPAKKETPATKKKAAGAAEAKKGKVMKPHRFRPGTVALRDIRRHQKSSDCLAFPKLPFSRLVREIAQDFKNDLSFAKGVFDLLQLASEDYLIKLCTAANECCLHAGRQTVSILDIQLVRKVMGICKQ